MIKKIVLKLKNIKYLGDSIGDDIRFEADILGKYFSVKKRIKSGTEQNFDSTIGEFDTDRKIFEALLSLRVIEDDPIFNDTASFDTEIKIDTTKNQQDFLYEVSIKEIMIRTSKDKAVFKITLQAEIFEEETVTSETSDGWLTVELVAGGKKSLPAFLRVKILRSDGKKDYFTILEGPYQTKDAFVSKKLNILSYLQSGILVRDPVFATYSISSRILTINGKKYKTTDFESEKWEIGVYDIEIPDAPHKGGASYTDKAKFAKVWFRIGHKGAKYLHTGMHSLGCITVLEQDKWDEIYHELIKARKGDGMSVGTLTVIE